MKVDGATWILNVIGSANLRTMVVVTSLVCLVCLMNASPGMAGPGKVDEGELCSRKTSHFSCIMGCYKCAELYGRRVYDMASCCAECQRSRALVVDNGPEFCSRRFLPQASVSMKGYLQQRKRSVEDDM